MSAKAVELSTAIVDAIKAGAYSRVFTTQRRVLPFSDVQELREIQVVVFDAPRSQARRTRVEFEQTYKPTVAVLKKLEAGDEASRLAESDDLQEIVEEIEGVLQDQNLADLTFIGFDEEQDRDPYAVELMKTLGCFAVAITLSYTN